MLPAYIIEEIRKREKERKRERRDELYIERPTIDELYDPFFDEEEDGDRGVVIIDFGL